MSKVMAPQELETLRRMCESMEYARVNAIRPMHYYTYRSLRLGEALAPRGRPRDGQIRARVKAELERAPWLSARNIAANCECSYNTARRVLRSWGLNTKGRRMKSQNLHIIAPESDYGKARRSRIITEKPGQLVHADTKLACKLRGGRRVHLFVLVDNFSSYGWAVPMGGKTANDTAVALQRAVSHFPFPIETLYTDNGVEFTGGAFVLQAERLAERIKRTQAKHPWSNGKVEALNKTIKYEVMPAIMSWKVYATHAEVEPPLSLAMLWYNVKRRHFGKNNGGRSPLQVLQDYAESLADAGDKALLESNLSTVFGAEGDLHRQLLLRLPETFGVPLLDLAPSVLSKATGLALPRTQHLERPAELSPFAREALNSLDRQPSKPVYLSGEAQDH